MRVMAKKTSKKFYAFATGGEEGIVESWTECSLRVQGRPARYKGFPTREAAQTWLDGGAVYEEKGRVKQRQQEELPDDAIYFDAGTGRGLGTESRVTDRAGTPLTWMALEPHELTPEGNLRLKGRTNNYGELTAFCLACEIAMKQGKKLILGDSKLVIEYWSKGFVSRKVQERDPDLIEVVKRAKALRARFEATGGRVAHVSGDVNPADLGFHR